MGKETAALSRESALHCLEQAGKVLNVLAQGKAALETVIQSEQVRVNLEKRVEEIKAEIWSLKKAKGELLDQIEKARKLQEDEAKLAREALTREKAEWETEKNRLAEEILEKQTELAAAAGNLEKALAEAQAQVDAKRAEADREEARYKKAQEELAKLAAKWQ